MFKHPSYYKELRKRNKSDRVISSCSNSTELDRRAPGQGPTRQAIEESVPHNDIEEAQASSSKQRRLTKREERIGWITRGHE